MNRFLLTDRRGGCLCLGVLVRAVPPIPADLRGGLSTPPGIVFGKVDTETEQSLAAAANITSIPTLMAFKAGALVFAQPGALPPAAFEDLIGRIRALDVEQLRAGAGRQEAAAAQGSGR